MFVNLLICVTASFCTFFFCLLEEMKRKIHLCCICWKKRIHEAGGGGGGGVDDSFFCFVFFGAVYFSCASCDKPRRAFLCVETGGRGVATAEFSDDARG